MQDPKPSNPPEEAPTETKAQVKTEKEGYQQVYLTGYLSQLAETWRKNNSGPVPLIVGHDGKPQWVNRKRRRMIEAQRRKRK